MTNGLAVDIGGTFTDVVLLNEKGEMIVKKSPTTPSDLTEGMLDGISKTNVSLEDVNYFVHGTTIVLNALLERRGVTVGLITTKGFRDVLEIMRTNRPRMYSLQQDKPEPLVPRYLRFEISERLGPEGNVISPVKREEVISAVHNMLEHDVKVIAVSLLHSYANPDHEYQVKQIIEEEFPHIPVTISSGLTREWREFERTSTVSTNAYTLSNMQRYLGNLNDRLTKNKFNHEVLIMQSNGGIMGAKDASNQPVRSIMSGPAGGVVLAEYLSRMKDIKNMITFDMGGTSADICMVINGKATVKSVQEIDRIPVLQPSIDITAIGAGGGSIAWLDEGNALQVGPKSAGSNPGPVCYDQGGELPTVTDANLVLGYIDPNYFLGGEIKLNKEKAREAIEEKIAKPLGLTVNEAAEGIIQIVNANMVRALRRVSVEHGYDPRDFTLVPYGGAGGLHAAQLAQELGISRIVVPRTPGVASAMGMLVADVRHDYAQTHVQSVDESDEKLIENIFKKMEEQGKEQLLVDGIIEENTSFNRTVDLRYSGQEYTINTPFPIGEITLAMLEQLKESFHELHENLYTFRMPNEEIVFVNFRVNAIGKKSISDIYGKLKPNEKENRVKGMREVYFRASGHVDCEIYDRKELVPEKQVDGPAVIEEPDSTILVPLEASVVIDTFGNLVVKMKKGDE